jgi:hypothetical protein
METESHIEITGIAHSITGASGAKRWMNCPGSIPLTLSLGEKGKGGTSEPAAEGTCAHEVLANCLTDQREPWEFIGTTMQVDGYEFIVDDEMTSAVDVALEHIRHLLELHGEKANSVEWVKVFVEESMRHSEYPEDLFGTTDFALLVKHVDGTYTLYIVDYKHGIGVIVEPTSEQLFYYANLVLNNLGPDEAPDDWSVIEVVLTIVQPRAPHPKGPIRTHRCNGQDLMDWYRESLEPALLRTKEPDAELKVGEWCGFCPAKKFCSAQKTGVEEFDTDTDPVKLTAEQIGELLDRKSAIMKYFAELEKLAFDKASRGETIPGFKLVRKRANRTWKAGVEKILLEKFGDSAYTEPKLLGPPGIEKLPGGSKFVAQYAFTPDTGLTLAPITDKRTAMRSDVDVLSAMDDDDS